MRLQPTGHSQRKICCAGQPAAETRRWAILDHHVIMMRAMFYGLNAEVKTRDNYSIPHLISACHFARALKEVEQRHSGWGEHWNLALANASAVQMLVIASLESYINEVFVDAHSHFPTVSEPLVRKLSEAFDRKAILEKYELALLLRDCSIFDRADEVITDIQLILSLRNSLVHFKPEWTGSEKRHKELSKNLRGKFSLSPFVPSTSSVFPRGWASYSCCKWSINAAISFLEQFERRSKLPSTMDAFKNKLVI